MDYWGSLRLCGLPLSLDKSFFLVTPVWKERDGRGFWREPAGREWTSPWGWVPSVGELILTWNACSGPTCRELLPPANLNTSLGLSQPPGPKVTDFQPQTLG